MTLGCVSAVSHSEASQEPSSQAPSSQDPSSQDPSWRLKPDWSQDPSTQERPAYHPLTRQMGGSDLATVQIALAVFRLGVCPALARAALTPRAANCTAASASTCPAPCAVAGMLGIGWAVALMAYLTWLGVSEGFWASTRAATPATTGAAIEVPESRK